MTKKFGKRANQDEEAERVRTAAILADINEQLEAIDIRIKKLNRLINESEALAQGIYIKASMSQSLLVVTKVTESQYEKAKELLGL